MHQKLLQEIGQSQRLCVVNALKRSEGLSVGDLAERLKMSYMGVKQHCIHLEKRGYLDTWRHPQRLGRPKKVYRLTEKAMALYPKASNSMTISILESVRSIYGSNVPDKLLYQHFQTEGEFYRSKIKRNSVAERAEHLAKLREKQGYMAECHYTRGEGLRIVEYHSPIQDLIDEFPNAKRMEETMISQVIQAPVTRREQRAGGLVSVVFEVETL